MQPTVWIRLKLPDEELRSLKREFPEVDFFYGEEAARDPQQFDAVFTEEPLPDDLVTRMPKLRWLHVTRGGAAAQKWELLMPIFAENLRRFLLGEKLLNLVDKERGY